MQPDPVAEPKFANIGGVSTMLLKNGKVSKIVYSGNNGVNIKSKAQFHPSPLQRRAEHVYADVSKDSSRTSALDVVLEVYADSTHAKISQAMWTNKAKRKATKVGQDGIFWIRKVDKSVPASQRDLTPVDGAEYWDLFTEYNSIDEADVRAHCNNLRSCVYALEDCEDTAEWLNSSIGPELHKQVHMNGVEDLPGPLLCYRIMKEYSVSNRSKCVSARNRIGSMSIKKDPELNYSKLSNALLQEIHLIQHTDPDYMRGTEDVGMAVVKALTVEPGWVTRNVDSVTLKNILQELEEKQELGEKLEYQYLQDKLKRLAEIHKNLKEVGGYAPATRKPKPEDQKHTAMMAQVDGLKKEVESLKGNIGDNGGGSGGGGNNGTQRDKSQLTCHACNQKGHFKYEKVCPKYDETMAKQNESGGGSNTGGNKS